jgi:hypothetical protein
MTPDDALRWTPQHKDAFRTYSGPHSEPPAAIWVQSTINLVYGGEVSIDGEPVGSFGSLKRPVRLVSVGMTSDAPWLNRIATQANRGAYVTGVWLRFWLPDAQHARRHVPTVYSALGDACVAFAGNGWLALDGKSQAESVVAFVKDHLRHAWDRHSRQPPQWVETDAEVFAGCDQIVNTRALNAAHGKRR